MFNQGFPAESNETRVAAERFRRRIRKFSQSNLSCQAQGFASVFMEERTSDRETREQATPFHQRHFSRNAHH
jgi:hypothetical protein